MQALRFRGNYLGHSALRLKNKGQKQTVLISVPHVKAIEGDEIIIGDVRIPISRNLREQVTHQILGNRLFKR